MSTSTARPIAGRVPVAITLLLAAGWACSDAGGPTGPATAGAIEVRVTTAGLALDPDGYTLILDAAPATTIGPQATRLLEGLSAGPHTVALSGLANNCAIYGSNPVVVQVRAGATTATAIVVTCQGQAGIIRTVAFTTGTSQDSDGYLFSIDSGPPTAVGTNGSVETRSVLTGDHTVGISGIAANCHALTPTPQVIRVEHNSIAQVRFAVSCAPAVRTSVVYVSGFDLQLVDWDGANARPVATFAYPTDPAWSPDREWIAFSGTYTERIALIRPDGSDLHWLPATTRNGQASFSPDGTRLVFVEGNCGQLATMNVDGSGLTQLLADARCQASPDWSPDGTAIVFEMASRIFRINVDGTNLTQLLEYGTEPSWSPDGTKILFTRDGRIRTMNSNGSGEVDLGTGEQPAWSPDGSSVVFAVNTIATGSHLHLMNADGSAVQILTTAYSYDRQPAWSP